MRRTPSAIVTVVTATRPSGMTETAKLFFPQCKRTHSEHSWAYRLFAPVTDLIPMLTMDIASCFHATPIMTTRAHKSIAIKTSTLPSVLSRCWIGVLVLCFDPAWIAELILPISKVMSVLKMWIYSVKLFLSGLPQFVRLSGRLYPFRDLARL